MKHGILISVVVFMMVLVSSIGFASSGVISEESRRGPASKKIEAPSVDYEEKYPEGSLVSVVRWGRLVGTSYGYAGKVLEYGDDNAVSLEVVAFINVNHDVEPAPASGGIHLYKGRDIGTIVRIHPKFITGFYSGGVQENYRSPSELNGTYTISYEFTTKDNKTTTYVINCTETDRTTEVNYWHEVQNYSWTTYDKRGPNFSRGESFHQVAVKACKGLTQ